MSIFKSIVASAVALAAVAAPLSASAAPTRAESSLPSMRASQAASLTSVRRSGVRSQKDNAVGGGFLFIILGIVGAGAIIAIVASSKSDG